MRWAVISVKCEPQIVDAVSYGFIQAGCGGVMITGDAPVTVEGSLPVSDELTASLDSLQNHLNRFEEFGLPAVRDTLTLRYAEDEDWADAWRKYFKPIRIGKRLIIKPSWELYEPESDELIIELDPGMAFGTGGHPTTRLCMEALEELVKPGDRIADIGTGSGILSITAARLGAAEVFATDIDRLPRRVAGENVARNEMEEIIQVLDLESFDSMAHDCDLVVANIVSNTIVEIAPSIPGRLKPAGIFIGSGIVEEHHDLVIEALGAVGIKHEQTLRDDIWVCLICRKSASASIDIDEETLGRASAELPPIGGVGIIR